MFPHLNIHKYTWTSDVKTHNQIDHVLLDKRYHSIIVNIRFVKELTVIATITWWL
jgi:hypothetical protein